MFTIKHIDNGVEALYQRKYVGFRPYEFGSGPRATGAVFAYDDIRDESEYVNIICGRVYVVNEHGSTVASYECTPYSPPAQVNPIPKTNQRAPTPPGNTFAYNGDPVTGVSSDGQASKNTQATLSTKDAYRDEDIEGERVFKTLTKR